MPTTPPFHLQIEFAAQIDGGDDVLQGGDDATALLHVSENGGGRGGVGRGGIHRRRHALGRRRRTVFVVWKPDLVGRRKRKVEVGRKRGNGGRKEKRKE